MTDLELAYIARVAYFGALHGAVPRDVAAKMPEGAERFWLPVVRALKGKMVEEAA